MPTQSKTKKSTASRSKSNSTGSKAKRNKASKNGLDLVDLSPGKRRVRERLELASSYSGEYEKPFSEKKANNSHSSVRKRKANNKIRKAGITIVLFLILIAVCIITGYCLSK